ncbi:MAG: FtsQ-type POTRA domain-containing protein [Treponema sp.]|jgi:cell division protein FtsQ|nr:FtsQ-type POTRA domain-containing protein [Treponema sp.]
MAGDFMYSEEILPAKPAVRKIEKGLKRFIIIAAVILGAEFIWLFAVSPCMPLSTVEVKTVPGFDRDAILALAGIGKSTSFMTMNVKAAEKALAAHYLVESVKVIKRFPDRVSIFIEKRQAAALSLVSYQGRILPVYFDREGVIFQIGDGNLIPPSNLPIISGLVFEDPHLGMRLPASFCPLLAEIETLQNSAPELLSAISEIKINRKPFDGFDLVLYPVHFPVKVRLENNLNEATLRYVMLMLDVYEGEKGRGLSHSEIDFRSGVASYTIKEVPSGE